MANELERVAFFGLGIMGGPMAANLGRAGFDLSVWTRTDGKAERFAAEHGVRAAATPAEAAEGADALISIVPDAPEVEAVLFGEAGAAGALASGALVVDMSTIAPSAAVEIGERLHARRARLPRGARVRLDAQGRGRDAHDHGRRQRGGLRARAAAVRGDGRAHRARRARRATASSPSCSRTSWARSTRAALAEAVVAVRAAGIDPDAFLEVAAGSAGNSAMVTLKGRPMFDESFEPLFKLEHMLKDIRHCLAEAEALGVELRLGALAETLYARAAEEGHGEEDFAAVLKAVE